MMKKLGWPLICVTCAVLSGSLAAAFSNGPAPVVDEVRAKRFVVVAESGEVIGTFGINEHNVPVMSLRGLGDKTGGAGIAIGNGVPSLYLQGSQGKPALEIVAQEDGTLFAMTRDSRGELALTYTAFVGGRQTLHMHARDNSSGGIELRTEPNGRHGILLLDSPGRNHVELWMKPQEGGSMLIRNEKGDELFKAP